MNASLLNSLTSVRTASKALNRASVDLINKAILHTADLAEQNIEEIIRANAEDLARMDPENPKYDRLKLTPERIKGIASDMRNVVSLASPLGITLKEWQLENGLSFKKVTVPFGVIGIIYEARPNVTFDVFSLCMKSGNACVLKGGSDARCTNEAIIKVIHRALTDCGLPEDCACLLELDHEATKDLLTANGYVDLIIPRGSSRLIKFVRDNASVPVIETGAGICHCYFHTSGNTEMGKQIINNAKTRRVSVCNALDCLIVDKSRLADLPELLSLVEKENVMVYADEQAYNALNGKYKFLEKADDESWGHEYLDYKMSVKTVDNLDAALEHIAKYSSKHSESIVAEDENAQRIFQTEVDAACVYTNLPTAFTDGAQFGFGAEIGISTQKLHARGPMALPELTTYKYLISGNGQIRSK